MMTGTNRHARRGFTLIELAIVLAVSATLFAGLWRLMSGGGQQLRDQTVATQQQQVISAAKTFLASATGQGWLMGLTSVSSNLYLPTTAGTCTGTPCLASYLPSGFTTTGSLNAYSQAFSEKVGVVTASHSTSEAPKYYSFMVLTTGGDTIPDSSGGRIASLIGNDGGFIYKNTAICSASVSTTTACGAYGSWSATTSDYNLTGSGGHVASRTFVSADQDATSPWLARSTLSGNSNYNTMYSNLFFAGGTGVGIYMNTSTSATTGGGSINLQAGCLSGTNACNSSLMPLTSTWGIIQDMGRAFIGNTNDSGPVLTLLSATGTTTTALQANGNVQVTGSLHAASFLYTSDLRLKTDVEILTNTLDKLAQLRAVSFTLKDSGRHTLGLIAQELEKVYPELVIPIKDGYKGIDYMGMIGPLVSAVQELRHENDALKKRIDAQDILLQKLEEKIADKNKDKDRDKK